MKWAMEFSVGEWRGRDSVSRWRKTMAEEGGRVEKHDIQKPVEELNWTTTFWRIVDSNSVNLQHSAVVC